MNTERIELKKQELDLQLQIHECIKNFGGNSDEFWILRESLDKIQTKLYLKQNQLCKNILS
jgi:hypothetical protein